MTKPASPKFELNDFQRVYFEFLRDRLPEVESDDELARLIMSKGLFALMKEQTDQKAATTEKCAMAPKPLPTHYRVILEPDEQTALEYLFELEPRWREPFASRRGDRFLRVRPMLEAVDVLADCLLLTFAATHSVQPQLNLYEAFFCECQSGGEVSASNCQVHQRARLLLHLHQ